MLCTVGLGWDSRNYHLSVDKFTFSENESIYLAKNPFNKKLVFICFWRPFRVDYGSMRIFHKFHMYMYNMFIRRTFIF